MDNVTQSVRIDIDVDIDGRRVSDKPGGGYPVEDSKPWIHENHSNRLFMEERISSNSSTSSSNGYTSYYGSLSFNPSITFRPLLPSDYKELKQVHESLFPIKYEEEFYKSVVYGRGIISWAAIDMADSNRLIGFVTAKIMKSHEVEDAGILGFEWNRKSRSLIYILTLGVIPSHRKLGIASSLISKVKDFSISCQNCRGIYLHVIDYNKEAIAFYQSNDFKCLYRLNSFYLIDNIHYDAFLYVYYVNGGYSPYMLLDIVSSSSFSVWKCLCSLPSRFLKRFRFICAMDIASTSYTNKRTNDSAALNPNKWNTRKMDSTIGSRFTHLFGLRSH